MSLRKRLFLSVGGISLLVCILSYVIPNYLTQKQMKIAGEDINHLVIEQEKKIYQMFSEILQYNFQELNNNPQTLCNLLHEMSMVAKKNIVFIGKDQVLAYNKEGNPFSLSLEGLNVDDLKENSGQLVWKDTPYNYLKYHIDSSWNGNLLVISPADQSFSVIPVIDNLRHSIAAQVSLNLLAASLCIFGLSLLFLSRTSKRITDPITILAQAANDLEDGKLEGIVLPNLKHRKDEVATLTHSFEKMIVALKDREKIRGVLNKVVSKEIASEILKSKIELGGEKRIATLIFSDIRDFTKMTAHMDPKAVIAMMNSYFTDMCRIIDTNEGVVDKFVGDEIMALYGTPIYKENHAISAIQSAIEMIKTSTLPIGIGIHTGEMVAGNVGSENRLNYTVLGANVNLAARLCQHALPRQILVSEQTVHAAHVKDSFAFEELPPMAFKGFEDPIKVYSIRL